MTTLLSHLGRAFAFSSVFFCLGYGLSLRSLLLPPASPEAALEVVDQAYRADLDSLVRAIEAYHLAVTSREDPTVLRRLHRRTRHTFKRTEYLLEYMDPQAIKRHINGAPLPTTEPNVPEVVVIEPTGLQVLDELVWSDETDFAELARLTAQLRTDYGQLYRYLRDQPLQHRQIFEAMREEVVRIFTLGITGFDTPGSAAQALPEARTALQRLYTSYRQYAPFVAGRDLALDRSLRDAFANGMRQLASGNFDEFDRLSFLRQCINPLTAGLPRAQQLLAIESAADDPRQPRPTNPEATSLFSSDFLNADFYAYLEASPQDAERQALGERLFYDPILSEDGQMSCATCHRPELAFTDGRQTSVAGGRNAPTLLNSVYAERYFYDLREEFLERQVKHVVADAHEFATDFASITARLAASDDYAERFAEAYAAQPRYALSAWSISDALARYVRSLRGFDSPFDRYARGETDELDPAAKRGFNLFAGKAVCATCHFSPTFAGLVPPLYRESETEVLGVPARAVWEDAPLDPDLGRLVSGRPQDEAYFRAFSFKTPTVRNIALTAPYMHNGVYDELAEVVRFYNVGGGKGIGIHLEHQTLPFDSLGLTATEMADIVVFMENLTDEKN